MQKKQQLLERLDAIGTYLQTSGTALALIGLGSTGIEIKRLDEYSDLDFFVIVQPGFKHQYLDHLDWLSVVRPIAYAFQNTSDGYKVLFDDGLFCEFGVFELHELLGIPFTGGRFIWKDETFDENLYTPQTTPKSERPLEFHLGEALTNLYIGLGRVHRGEKLSGTRFIQYYAIDHVIELSHYIEPAQSADQDIFAHERRYETRHPLIARYLPDFVGGYDHNKESALAILKFLKQHFVVSPAMSEAIEELCADH